MDFVDLNDDNDSVGSNNSSSEEEDFAIVDVLERRSKYDDYQFEVLSAEQIVQDMIDTVNYVNNIVNLPSTTTRILLNYFKWEKEELIEKFFNEDEEKFFREAHVVNPLGETALVDVSKPSQSTTEKCIICFSVFPSGDMTGLQCGHRFCAQCWRQYLTTNIMEGLGESIKCVEYGCGMLVDDATVMQLVTDTRVKIKYQHLITNSFVECNKRIRWCPGRDCTFAIKVLVVDACPVKCKCGYVFCFDCGQNWHDAVQCQLLKKWIRKCGEDSESYKWIAANTKKCPRCNATIQKDGGCNHMTCKNQHCRHEFCWVCLGTWGTHRSCNGYDDEAARAARNAQEKFVSSIERYKHYYDRYMNHIQSLKFENKLYTSVKEKMEEIQQNMSLSWIEVQFLKKAVDVLCQCRETLKCTYIFAYYVKKNNQSIIFEDNQRDLESATETLSEYLERDMTSADLADIKQKVQNKYRYCERRRKRLLDHVGEGHEKGWWNYTE